MTVSKAGQDLQGVKSIPKQVWVLWLQGIDQAPEVVRKCYRTWVDLNLGWDIILLDENNLGDYVDIQEVVAKQPRMEAAALSDIIRANLLAKHGGVWVDATCFCRSPLDTWLPDVTQTGFFAFSRPVKKSLVAVWFMAASRGNPLMTEWAKATEGYVLNNPGLAQRPLTRRWFNRLFDRNVATTRYWFSYPMRKIFKIYPYYWFMYLLARVIRKDRKSRAIWEATPKLTPPNPGRLHRNGLLQPLTPELKDEIDNGNAPVYKLSWRYDEHLYRDDSVLAYIIS